MWIDRNLACAAKRAYGAPLLTTDAAIVGWTLTTFMNIRGLTMSDAKSPFHRG